MRYVSMLISVVSYVNDPSMSLGLIYQSNIETSTDPNAEIILRQNSRVIHPTLKCWQSYRMLINVTGENNGHLHITPLNIHGLEASLIEFDREKRNLSEKRK